MKDILKLIFVCAAAIVGGAIPASCAYLFWDWTMAQVPAGEWAGLIKVGLTLFLIFTGGAAVVAVSILLGMVGGAISVFIVELFESKPKSGRIVRH